MASVVEICNNALNQLGASTILSLTEDSKNARLCNARYESIRNAVFRSHAWNCLMARQELAADTYAYAWILNSGYTKNDALSSLEILNKYSDTSEWHNFFSTHPDTKKRIRNIQMQ